MKNKLILTLCLILTLTPNASMLASDGWLEYFVSFIWEAKKETQNSTAQPSQNTERPKPSAPPHEPQYYPKQSQPSITYAQREQVKRDLEGVIDGLFSTTEQERNAQREIQVIKEQALKCIAQRCGHCKTVQELRSVAHNNLNVCLATIIAKNARLLYEQEASKSTGIPAYNPIHLATQIEEDIKAQANLAIRQNIRGVLVLFVGRELKEHIAAKVARDFPKPKQASPIVAPSNPAPDNIYEVYVHENAARYEQIVAKIQQGKVHRQDDCCVCLEDFGVAKKRATLACGHSICPDCLYACLYNSNNKTCPVCRNAIASDEFPSAYLSQFIS